MGPMNRRDLLKLIGISTAAAVVPVVAEPPRAELEPAWHEPSGWTAVVLSEKLGMYVAVGGAGELVSCDGVHWTR
jgi:hypothetical protein